MTPTQMPTEKELRAEITRLEKVVSALMNRVEKDANGQGSHFDLFQSTAALEQMVQDRTKELREALYRNEEINRALAEAQRNLRKENHERRRMNRELEREQAEQKVLIKQLEDAHFQLLQSEKLASIGQLAAGVAHEINNPIGYVISNLDTLKEYAQTLVDNVGLHQESAQPSSEDADELNYVMEDILPLIVESAEGADRVRKIVEDLRDFSRSGGDEWEIVDVHKGLESTINVAMSEFKHRLKIKQDFGQIPKIECIPPNLNQVFLNLLVNAAQATDGQGTIELSTECVGDSVQIRVRDEGCGMEPDVISRIFDPFFTTKPVGKGTGLGLSVSYGIIEKHGGEMLVDSKPGEGTTFTIRLPIRQEAEQ